MPTIRGPRSSLCAQRAFDAELSRLRRMSIEERIAEALSMNERFSWLQPAEGQSSGQAVRRDEACCSECQR